MLGSIRRVIHLVPQEKFKTQLYSSVLGFFLVSCYFLLFLYEGVIAETKCNIFTSPVLDFSL